MVLHTEVQPDAMSGSSKLVVTGQDLTAMMDLIDFSGLPYPGMSPDMRVLTDPGQVRHVRHRARGHSGARARHSDSPAADPLAKEDRPQVHRAARQRSRLRLLSSCPVRCRE